MWKFLDSALRHPTVLSLACGAWVSAGAGCAVAFHDAKTPSGQYCSDMPVVLNGQPDPDRPFHRIKPISTPPKPLTAPERLEALRVESCNLGGDAVINAGDEEMQTPDHTVIVRASGYAIRWMNNAIKAPTLHQTVGQSIGAPATLAASPPPPEGDPAPGAVEAGADGAATPPAKSPASAPRKPVPRK